MPENSSRVRRVLDVMGRVHRTSGTSGVVNWLGLVARRRMGITEPERLRQKPRMVSFPVTARLRGSSDLNVYAQIFEEEEYASLRDIRDVRTVMDLGANVGYSSAYFLSAFPQAQLFAVEADSRNYEVCRENLRPYGERARVINAAAWCRNEMICLSRGTFGDGREWASEVKARESAHGEEVQGLDVPSLMEQSGFEQIDFLKIDIEGSELQVFPTAEVWLERVRNLCIELHGSECEKAFFEGMSAFDYQLSHAGELTICRDIKRK